MTKKALSAVFFVALAAFPSCRAVSNLIHDDQVVASVDNHHLYLSEVAPLVPPGTPSEDSLALVNAYIDSWASGILYADLAEENLAKGELDLTREMEAYRASVLKFRYEQHYLADRLDTLITAEQVERYYRDHESRFTLDSPVVKARFLRITAEVPERAKIIRLMGSSEYDDLMEADSLARIYADKYFDKSDEWISASALASEFGTDVENMLSSLNGGFITKGNQKKGELRTAKVCGIVRSGVAPLEYIEPKVRELILSERRHALLVNLESDLLDNARRTKKLQIY
ncbi:MAG: hypothetical protein MJY44_06020 [Bacteroidales bacterium]|nr:hypothetical protein [Bacteroidales bacterium]